MKSKEWVSEYAKYTSTEEFLEAYAKETKELIAKRTAGSGKFEGKNKKVVDTSIAAKDGAIREQKQKFLAICEKVPNLHEELFDKVLIPCYISVATQLTTKENTSPEEIEKCTVGRKLVAS